MIVRRSIVTVLVAFCGLNACAGFQKPDLERLYRDQRGNPDQPPIIIVPGLLGSRLGYSDGKEVWPGSALRLLG